MQPRFARMAHKLCEPSLFISHATEDYQPALEIVDKIERRGLSCWIAPRDVLAGKPYRDEIADAIERCRAMLVVFSEHCNSSMWVPREVAVADDAGKTIITLRVEDAQPKRGLKLCLANLQRVDAFSAPEQAIEEVMRAVRPQASRLPKVTDGVPKQAHLDSDAISRISSASCIASGT